MKKVKVLRVIVLYNKVTEVFEREIVLDDFDLMLMKRIFNVHNEDPLMYDCYKVDEPKTQLFPKIKFDLNNYHYYLECHTI